MRIAAICLPELRVEVVRRAAERASSASASASTTGAGVDEASRPGTPLAIVVAPSPMTEQKLLGNSRLDIVSREARSLGVMPGQTIAAARARASNLAVRVVRPDAVRSELARLAEVALAFGATVSFSGAGIEGRASSSTSSSSSRGAVSKSQREREALPGIGDVVWVDVTGCAHLHAPSGGTPADGEVVLATRLANVFRGLGHACAIAIADGPRIAAILAASAAEAQAVALQKARRRPRADAWAPQEDEPMIVVVPPGKNAAAMAELPIAALPLPAEDVHWLTKLGVRTVAELRLLPRSALATRLGTFGPIALSLAEGDDRAPLAPYVPPEIPEEAADLEYGIEGSDALTFVAKTLTDRIGLRLAGRAVAAARIELDLTIDTALLPDHERHERNEPGARVQRLAVDLPRPLSAASDLLAALRPKIERFELRAPVLRAVLRAPNLVHKPQAALSLFEAQPKAERALPRLVAELASDLGEDAVGKLALGDAWSPEDRSKLVRLDTKAPSSLGPSREASSRGPSREKKKRRRHILSSVPEPTRILAEPRVVPRDAVKVVRHLTRLESVEWWKYLPGEGPKKGVDFVYAWFEGGPAWVELDRSSRLTKVRGWFD